MENVGVMTTTPDASNDPAGPAEPRQGPAAPSAARRPDAVCAAAVELARQAIVESGGEHVGDHLAVVAEGERLVTHHFEAREPGYRGWRWSVTVARAPRAKIATVCEVALLPGSGALLPPQWVPWSERLRPGDLGVGDILPTDPDDDRLAPAYLLSDDPAVEEVQLELGLGRIRVMSRLGRLEAADRWYTGDSGPTAPLATHAPAHCGTCAFYLPIDGALGAMFGVCANLFAPDDGKVVSADHGCGAHSEALVQATVPVDVEVVLDDAEVEVVSLAEHGPGSVDDGETTEPFGHG
jgi:hypothetical protein